MPDDIFGEVVGVWIVRNSSEEAGRVTRQGVRERVGRVLRPQVGWIQCTGELCSSPHEQNAPAWVWFVGEDGDYAELPKTASGKVMKHVLREWGKALSRKDIGRVVT